MARRSKEVSFKMKNNILKWLIFLRFFFPELKNSIKGLFILQFIFLVGSIILAILHTDKLNIAGYHLCTALVLSMGMNYIKIIHLKYDKKINKIKAC